MNKTLIRLIFVPIVVLVAGFRLVGLLMAPSPENDENAPAPAAPSVYSGNAVRSQASFLKLHALQNKVTIAENAALTDEEVAWLLQARKAADPAKPYAESIARARPLEVLLHTKLTSTQKDKVFFAVLPDFNSRDKWGAVGDRVRACDAIAALHDKRGIRYVVPLLNHPDERVRVRAKRALHSLGTAP